jgi:hypothetical protein
MDWAYFGPNPKLLSSKLWTWSTNVTDGRMDTRTEMTVAIRRFIHEWICVKTTDYYRILTPNPNLMSWILYSVWKSHVFVDSVSWRNLVFDLGRSWRPDVEANGRGFWVLNYFAEKGNKISWDQDVHCLPDHADCKYLVISALPTRSRRL